MCLRTPPEPSADSNESAVSELGNHTSWLRQCDARHRQNSIRSSLQRDLPLPVAHATCNILWRYKQSPFTWGLAECKVLMLTCNSCQNRLYSRLPQKIGKHVYSSGWLSNMTFNEFVVCNCCIARHSRWGRAMHVNLKECFACHWDNVCCYGIQISFLRIVVYRYI